MILSIIYDPRAHKAQQQKYPPIPNCHGYRPYKMPCQPQKARAHHLLAPPVNTLPPPQQENKKNCPMHVSMTVDQSEVGRGSHIHRLSQICRGQRRTMDELYNSRKHVRASICFVPMECT